MIINEQYIKIQINNEPVEIVVITENIDGEELEFVYGLGENDLACEQLENKFYWTIDGYPAKIKPPNSLIVERALSLFNLTRHLHEVN